MRGRRGIRRAVEQPAQQTGGQATRDGAAHHAGLHTRPARGRHRRGPGQCFRRFSYFDGRDKAVAVPGDGFDVMGLRRVVAEGAAQRADALREGRVAHDHVVPDFGEQRVAGGEVARALHEGHEQVEVARGEVDGFARARQAPLRHVELKRPEPKGASRGREGRFGGR